MAEDEVFRVVKQALLEGNQAIGGVSATNAAHDE
jgi:hypothetical protein